MKSSEIQSEIEKQEAAQSALADQQQAIQDRLEFLQAEKKSLAWPVSQGEKKATARAAEIDSDLAGLRDALGSVAAEIAKNAGMLDELRQAHQAALLAELESERDRYALVEAETLQSIFERQGEIAILQQTAGDAHARAAALNQAIIKAGGADQALGTPWGSDTHKAEDIAERVKVLQARLG